MTEMTTDTQLRRRIAEALGYVLEKKQKGDELIFTIKSPDNHIIRQATVTEDSPLSEGLVWFNIPHWHIPDWPNDPGAALALCKGIAQERHYELRIRPGNGYLSTRAEFWTLPANGVQDFVCGEWSHPSIPQHSDERDTADALSRLADTALEAEYEEVKRETSTID